MPDALAIPLFYMLAGAVWFYWMVTTERQRQNLLEWCLVGVVCFGGVGLLYLLLTGQSIAPTGAP